MTKKTTTYYREVEYILNPQRLIIVSGIVLLNASAKFGSNINYTRICDCNSIF